MGFAEKRGNYWRGRYKTEPGKHLTVVDENGKTIKFATKGEAQRAASEAENKYRRGDWRDPALGLETFGEYAGRWYAAQDLAASTMQNYKRHIEEHLLPDFEGKALSGVLRTDVELWEKKERAVYAASSVKTWRSTLHLIFEDAIDEGLITSNPAGRRRGRGKRAGRSRDRGPEKVVTDALGILLAAERAALLSGRDDEFVAVVLKGYTGKRWGEIVGLETEFVRPHAFRVEWQLYELDTGELVRCPPKDDSYRTIDSMDWLSALVLNHIARTKPTPCPCHGRTYVFRGQGAARTGGHQGAKLVDVARLAGVSTGTVSNVLNHPDRVTEATRARVEKAVADLGFVRGGAAPAPAAHWRRNGFATWLFTPAVSGWYPKKAPQEARPVPLLGEPWPGVPARGRGATNRADACWLPIAKGLTPHGLRHTHRTMMEDLGTEKVLMDERMGHIDGSVSARYAHVTPGMRRRLMVGLTDQWQAALDARLAMCSSSPVRVLNELLRAHTARGPVLPG
ncbi:MULTISPECIES: LacI family DNA-binding transcriptional regulator [Streptomyces]|uniref:LacI family DNA-binding transcriptional regulator n=1 Tax=Streptomyces tsukubensis (strain DSM 42081 / NBRC 108919 / NRRL 18488 / 9993) TaxID=1114943 RepID=I2N309_STRT9|nr:LacI family DNA-binding transcriptional regulator [Streptomyces tsukubensis]MYS66663.1 LacI family DNA-binding transcriptional regulator [Streptomyces sp. SID5473]AZK95549.1 LacI family transcriptional regulator [Streptomyces tsukubensis]EIF91406.1 LacI family transcriptional regulator [Streptomyces tsukubensis NRRL18488]QKM68413.1 LacI family DNA-binding transcriptional regulator [Streptomyces tsukubensis NRRL18488]TAI43230.1 LacI family DNA-binding transcriptional regulator [Streptomyces 